MKGEFGFYITLFVVKKINQRGKAKICYHARESDPYLTRDTQVHLLFACIVKGEFGFISLFSVWVNPMGEINKGQNILPCRKK